MADSVAEMAVTTLRRNGKASSCEPCRKSKLSCDHLRPTCGRCQRRRVPDKCVYHPAPMTHSQQQSLILREESPLMPNNPRSSQHGLSVPIANHNDLPSLLNGTSDATSPPVPGFLGPTSFSAVFTEGESNTGLKEKDANREINIRGWQSPNLPSWDSAKLREGIEVLELLRDLEMYEPALQRWYQVEHSFPTVTFARECIALLPPDLKTKTKHGRPLGIVASKIFARTSTPSVLKADITMKEYPLFLMGNNMSWEIIGIILTVAGLSAIAMDEVNVIESESKTDWKDRARNLVRAGERCIAFVEEFGLLRDIGVHLIMLNFLLHSQVFGDSDYHCWRKSGDLTTAIFALGLHQEPSKIEIPFFLLELHRKLFWFAYICDKCFATFFGRPPLISSKFCSCKLPLDLEHAQLGLEGEALDRALEELDNDGWAPYTTVNRSSWVRVSIIAARLREEILELSLGANSDKLEERAQELRERVKQSEVSLPLKFRDQRNDWVLERTVPENFFQLTRRLEYLYSIFLLERALVKRLRVSSTELLKVSRSLLSTLLVTTGNRHRQGAYASDLPWLIALYLPSAGVLALELLHHSRNKFQAGYTDFPRSEVIQKLSNLVSAIDFIVRPTNGNYVICGQAKKMLQAILDTVLSPEHDQSEKEANSEASRPLDTSIGEGLDDQMWFNTNLDLDFWTGLEDHPLLAWPEIKETM